MKIRKRVVIKTTITLEMEDWEARDLLKILERMKKQKSVSKSEFSLREKITGRRMMELLHGINGAST